MNHNRQLQGSFWLMIAIQIIGAVDMPGKGPRKLPAPRAFVAPVILWAILGLIADAGAEAAAAAMGWVTVLVGAVVGPFGDVINNFLATVGTQFGTAVDPNAPQLQPTPPATHRRIS